MSDKYIFDMKLRGGSFDILIDTAQLYGYFEHDELGDECGGGLWFELNDDGQIELIDADGTYAVPKAVVRALISVGYMVDPDFYEGEL